MIEEPRSQDTERDEQQKLLPALTQPDHLRWWELQLGVAVPDRLYTEATTGP